MADVAWITLTIWPWDDAWLAEDEELHDVFDELELLNSGYRGGDGTKLAGAMNGDRDEVDGRTILTGEMRGGSYEIRGESSLLEILRDRGIAYELVGDAKYDWDGDEEWWHPGMEVPFTATANESGRVLTRDDYDRMVLAALPPPARIPAVELEIAVIREALDKAPEGAPWRTSFEQAIASKLEVIAGLREGEPDPVPLAVQLAAFFEPDPFAWAPPAGYRPTLKVTVDAD